MSHKGATSKIKIVSDEECFEAMLCVQCEDQRCVKVCDNSALFIDKYTGTPIISTNLCSKCMKCVLLCEFSGLHYDTVKEEITVCDTCNQRFLCIILCPKGALSKIILHEHLAVTKSF